MAEPLVYVDTSEVRPGRLAALKVAVAELAEFVEANEPRPFSYAVFFNADETRMTVVHVHPDSASLEEHMRVAGPLFPKFRDLVRLLSIHVYGTPSPSLVDQLKGKAKALGAGDVVVHAPHAGFFRFGRARP